MNHWLDTWEMLSVPASSIKLGCSPQKDSAENKDPVLRRVMMDTAAEAKFTQRIWLYLEAQVLLASTEEETLTRRTP